MGIITGLNTNNNNKKKNIGSGKEERRKSVTNTKGNLYNTESNIEDACLNSMGIGNQ